MEDNTEQRAVHLQLAVVLDEAKLAKSIQEYIYVQATCTDHFRGSLLS